MCTAPLPVARLIVLAAILVFEPLSGFTASPSDRTDLSEDVLPRDARARLSTPRFRHPSGVITFAFSPDGKALLSAGADKTIRLLDIVDGKEIRRFTHDEQYVGFAPDGQSAALMDTEGNIRILDLASGKERVRFKAPDQPNQGWIKGPLVFSPDGKTLITGSIRPTFVGIGDGTLHCFDVATGKKLRQFGPEDKHLRPGGVFSPDGKVLATAAADAYLVYRWDAQSGKKLPPLEAKGYATDLAFSPDGKTLAAALHPRNDVCLWDTATGKEQKLLLHPLDKGGESIRHVTYAPSGRLLASMSKSGKVWIWDVETGKILHTLLERPGSGRRPLRASGPIVFSRDSKRLVSLYGNTFRFWDVSTGKALALPGGHTGSLLGLAISPDGKTVVSRDDESVRLWDSVTGIELRTIAEPTLQMSLSADGKYLITLGANCHFGRIEVPGRMYIRGRELHGPLKVWDLTGKQEPRELPLPSLCRQVEVAPDGRTLAIAEHTDRITLWDVASGKELQHWAGNWQGTLVFVGDGKSIVSWRSFRDTYLLHVGEMGPPEKIDAEYWEGPIAISPDGRLMAGWADNTRFCVRQVPSGKLQATIRGLKDYKNAFFLDDGKVLAVHHDNEMSFWDTADGKDLRRINDVAGPLVFFPGFKTLAGVHEDGRTIGLWDVTTGKELGRLDGHRGRVISLAVSAQGTILVSGSEDCTAMVWDVSKYVRGK